MIVHEYFPLSAILYYRIGGIARFVLEARSRDDILAAIEFVRGSKIDRLVVVGTGSNILFPDGLFDGAVLRIVAGGTRQIRETGDSLVEAFAGESLDDVISFGFESGYTGLEWAGGLPGTVGAAVRGNVGAFGGEVKDVLERAEVLEIGREGSTIRNLSRTELGFSYRDSVVKRAGGLVVLSACFRLARAGAKELLRARQSYRSNVDYRWQNHPMEHPSCGSVFKNIEKPEQVNRVLAVWPDAQQLIQSRWHGKVSVGYAIRRLGLSGYQVGGAQISPKHCNFIVNLGNASFSDVHAIIEKVRDSFLRSFGFAPETEVEIVGHR